MNGKERNEHEALCPRCGAWAQWSLPNSDKNRVEVMCPDCGRYELDREEFDRTAVESAELEGMDHE
jgi:Zn-finger nucleic acid-binding protein